MHIILTEILACFLPGQAKDLPAPLYISTVWFCCHLFVMAVLSCYQFHHKAPGSAFCPQHKHQAFILRPFTILLATSWQNLGQYHSYGSIEELHFYFHLKKQTQKQFNSLQEDLQILQLWPINMKIVEAVNVKILITLITIAPYTLPASSFMDLQLNCLAL